MDHKVPENMNRQLAVMPLLITTQLVNN